MVDAAEILGQDVAKLSRRPENMKFGELRDWLAVDAGVVWPANDSGLMDVIQLVRNRIIHQGGIADKGVVSRWSSLSPLAKGRWTRVSGRSFRPKEGDRMELAAPEVRVSLAITTSLAKATNAELLRLVPRESWAKLLVNDWKIESGRSRINLNDVGSIRGFGKQLYGPLAFTEQELKDAIIG